MSPPPEQPVFTRSGSMRERLSFRRSSSRRRRQRSTSEEPSSTPAVAIAEGEVAEKLVLNPKPPFQVPLNI